MGRPAAIAASEGQGATKRRAVDRLSRCWPNYRFLEGRTRDAAGQGHVDSQGDAIRVVTEKLPDDANCRRLESFQAIGVNIELFGAGASLGRHDVKSVGGRAVVANFPVAVGDSADRDAGRFDVAGQVFAALTTGAWERQHVEVAGASADATPQSPVGGSAGANGDFLTFAVVEVESAAAARSYVFAVVAWRRTSAVECDVDERTEPAAIFSGPAGDRGAKIVGACPCLFVVVNERCRKFCDRLALFAVERFAGERLAALRVGDFQLDGDLSSSLLTN